MSFIGNPILTMNYPVDYFTGDGTTNSFFLSRIAASTTSLIVTINGVKQVASYSNPDYYLNGNTIVFNSIPANGAEIEVLHLGALSQVNVPSNQSITGNMISSNLTLASNTVISVNSSNPALRITQVGSGNALVVEDSANPDSTPFVVDQSGRTVIGATSSVSPVSGLVSGLGVHSTASVNNTLSAYQWSADGMQAFVTLSKSRGATPTTQSILSSGDTIGTLLWSGSDGTQLVQAARIEAVVDGTPGTNDMPGRLVFSTTADGASSPTERMRIDNAGQVGIGGAPVAGSSLSITKNITGATNCYGVLNYPTILSDVTAGANLFQTLPTTQATAFTMNVLRHYYANSQSFGAGSTVTNQYGFHAESSLTGATNNYGFYSNIASGTGRYNFYAAGSAANYFAGNVVSGYSAPITGTVTPQIQAVGTTFGGAALGSYLFNSVGSNSGLEIGNSRGSSIGTQGIVQVNDVLGSIRFVGSDGTSFIRGAAIIVEVDGTPGTSNMPGRLVFSTTKSGASSPTEAMRIDNQQRIGISTSNLGGSNGFINAALSLTGSVNSNGIRATGTLQSDATGDSSLLRISGGTAASAFTVNSLFYINAIQGTFGAGSTVSNQFGFRADASLTGATNNYGFYSNIASGTGRWNFYAAGTAENYFAGKVGIGVAPSVNSNLIVGANRASYPYSLILSSFNGATFENDLVFAFNGTRQIIGNYQSYPLTFQTNNASRLTIDSSGNVGVGTLTPTSGYMFDVAGNIILSGTGPEFRLNNGGPWLYVGTPNTLNIGVNNVASTANSVVTVNTTGVGIGTSSPSSKLHVRQDQDGTTRTIIQNRNASGTPLSELTFLTGAFDIADNRQAYIRSGGGSSTYLAFGTSNGNSPVEAFRINPTATTTFNYSIGIGTDAVASTKIYALYTTSEATSYGFLNNPVVGATNTTSLATFQSNISTAASTFTLGALQHFLSTQGTIGSGSAITNQYGFHAANSLTGATNNYGFFSNIASGSGRYNFYAAGTADNYFAGNVWIGASNSNYKLYATGYCVLGVHNTSTLPASNAAGGAAFYWNRNAGNAETDIVNLYDNAGISFEFAQKTGASTQSRLLQLSTSSLIAFTGDTERLRIDSSGNVGIGTNSPSYKLQVNGSFAATTKSFVIEHPTKTGKKLRYGSLEGPENGVYVRGRLNASNVIELPDYWTKLVDPDSITVQLTSIGKHQNLYVEDIVNNTIIVSNSNLLNKEINCFYIVHAERIDVDKLEVEID